jgi:tetratricopeptide (TPR) repeat protein
MAGIQVPNDIMISNKDFHIQILPRIEAATNRQDYDAAWKVLDEIIDDVSPEKKAHCYLLRGEIKDKLGDPPGARQEWRRGLQFSVPGSFGQLTLYHELGESHENAGEKEKALEYYVSAVKSCAEGSVFSSRKPLAAFLALNGGQIPPEYQETFAIAIQKSWRVHEFEGEPDLTDLPGSIHDLSKRFADLVRQIKGE